MDETSSFELTDFNIEGQIDLKDTFGFLKIARSEDGHLILVVRDKHENVEEKKVVSINIADICSILGFVLDIGIRKEKMLTIGSGNYFGIKLIHSQSERKVEQKDFNEELIKKIEEKINGYFKSGNQKKEVAAIRMDYLFTTYNNSRLLFPNFYNDSFLGLMRILDSLSETRYADNFALFVSEISLDINKKIYSRIEKIESYKNRLEKAEEVFCLRMEKMKKNNKMSFEKMEKFSKEDKFIFACFYSAYQYRNKFVHKGYPFPEVVKYAHGSEEDLGTAYIYPGLGVSLRKRDRPEGLLEEDYIDIHSVIDKEAEAKMFKDYYFLLLPTWFFLKQITREALVKAINDLSIK